MQPIMHDTHVEIDERWIADYVKHGIGQIQKLLDLHQAFYRYLAREAR